MMTQNAKPPLFHAHTKAKPSATSSEAVSLPFGELASPSPLPPPPASPSIHEVRALRHSYHRRSLSCGRRKHVKAPIREINLIRGYAQQTSSPPIPRHTVSTVTQTKKSSFADTTPPSPLGVTSPFPGPIRFDSCPLPTSLHEYQV